MDRMSVLPQSSYVEGLGRWVSFLPSYQRESGRFTVLGKERGGLVEAVWVAE